MSTPKPIRVAIYARVSTSDQTAENQLIDLRRFAQGRNWEIYREFVDEGFSGKLESRPELDQLMDAARKRLIDVVLVWKFDRFARSLKHLVLALEELQSLKINFVSYQENTDTTTSMGTFFFQIVAALSQLERSMCIDRVLAGMRRAKAQGKHIGRPPANIDVARALELKAKGISLREIGRFLGVSHAKVHAVIKAAKLNGVQKPGLVETVQTPETGVQEQAVPEGKQGDGLLPAQQALEATA